MVKLTVRCSWASLLPSSFTLSSLSKLFVVFPVLLSACDDSGVDGGRDSGVDSGRDSGGDGGRDGDVAGGVTYCAQIQSLLDRSCTGCHSSGLSGTARNGAPAGVDFDSYGAAVANAARAEVRIGAGTMPPGGGLASADRDLFAEWVARGLLECASSDGGVDGGGDAGDAGPSCSSGTHWTAGVEFNGSMRPGEGCLACHDDTTAPPFAIGGTVMGAFNDEDDCNGVEGVVVEITHAGGRVSTFTTNTAGNFWAELEDTTRIATPFTAKLLYQGRERAMIAGQTNTSCNACHTATGDSGAPGRIVAP